MSTKNTATSTASPGRSEEVPLVPMSEGGDDEKHEEEDTSKKGKGKNAKRKRKLPFGFVKEKMKREDELSS